MIAEGSSAKKAKKYKKNGDVLSSFELSLQSPYFLPFLS